MSLKSTSRTILSLLLPILLTLLLYSVIELIYWIAETFYVSVSDNFNMFIDNILILVVWFGLTLFFIRLSVYIGGLFKSVELSYSSKLISDIFALFIWFFSILILFVIVYDRSVSGLIAASSVSIAIIGFAIRNIVLDFISGIAMGVEKPFHIGDWIEYDNTVGAIQQINWRVTRIVTRDGIQVIIPNSHLASIPFRNYNMPKRHFRVTVELLLDYNVETKRVEHLLLNAANKIEALEKAPKQPGVKIKEFNTDGVLWELRFWIDDYAKKDNLTYAVQTNLLNNLKFSGIQMLGEKQTIFLQKNPVEQNFQTSAKALLANIDLFADLPDEDLDFIAESMQTKEYGPNESIIRQGDQEDTMFFVAEGLLTVSIDQNGEPIEVGKLSAGDFFGEMSLLLNEPRSASVVTNCNSICFQLNREDLSSVISKNAKTMQHLSIVLANRKVQNQSIVDRYIQKQNYPHNNTENGILLKIKSLFSV